MQESLSPQILGRLFGESSFRESCRDTLTTTRVYGRLMLFCVVCVLFFIEHIRVGPYNIVMYYYTSCEVLIQGIEIICKVLKTS